MPIRPNTHSTGAAPTEASTAPSDPGAARLIEPLGARHGLNFRFKLDAEETQMTIKKENLLQVGVKGIKAIGDKLNQIPKTISVEHTRVIRVWSNPGASYDRGQGIEDGEEETESFCVEEANPDYESLVNDLRLIYRCHPSEECRSFAGQFLGYSNSRIKYGRTTARLGLAVFALIILLGLLIVLWRYIP